ncbi:transcriptional regulator [Terriglobus sp. RCC_193]|uniref:transcriptional regulator n=1 Tax=Terriglobus sp. RCC_193 TaxID=3239218 RepID=UPI0035266214
MSDITAQLHRELWTSWASLLRSYSAVHSLGRELHAVVEVSDATILVRYGLRWMQFTHDEYRTSEGESKPFKLTENGRAIVGDHEDEMDLFAERLASAIITV